MNTTLADVLYPAAAGTSANVLPGGEPQSPPSDLQPNSPRGSSPGSDDDGSSRKRSASGSIKETKERTANKVCRVCGDKAYSYNFNVITCESCKAFFRRNANKEKEIRCPFNESCEINVVSRRFCQRCRLFKCFAVGMKKEWIMTDEARLEKKARVEENRERRREEARRKGSDDQSPIHHHYRTSSISSTGSGSIKHAAAAAAASAAADNLLLRQHQHQQQQQHAAAVQHLQPTPQPQQQPLFQPELPNMMMPSSSDLLDALAQQSAAAAVAAAAAAQHQHQQQPMQQPAPFPNAAAALVAAATAGPAPSNSELVAHALAIEEQIQQQRQQQQHAAAAAAALQQQAVAAHHHHQQQQQQQMAAAVAQQLASMTGPSGLTLQQQVATPATAAAILNAAAAAPLGSLGQAALMMDASAAAASQQLQQHLAAAAPPASALAAVATTMLHPQHHHHPMQQLQPDPLLQAAAAAVVAATPQHHLQQQPPGCCSCECKCGRYEAGRSIVEQAQEEWEADLSNRKSNSSAGSNEMGLSELLPSASTVNWLNPATNVNPLPEGPSSSLPIAISIDEAYGNLNELKESFLRNPLCPPTINLRAIIDPEFGPMEAEDEERLRFIHQANAVWSQPLDHVENKLHSQTAPSKVTMLQMMVGAVKRMIMMAKKFPALKALHDTDQLKLIRKLHELCLQPPTSAADAAATTAAAAAAAATLRSCASLPNFQLFGAL